MIFSTIAASIPSLLLGALLGAIFGMAFPPLYRRFLRTLTDIRAQRRTRLLSSGRVTKWLLDYYRSHGSHVELYRCRIRDTEVTIPFLSRPEWQTRQRLSPNEDLIVSVCRGQNEEFPVRWMLLKRRHTLGQHIFLGEANTLYLDAIYDGEELKISVRKCGFKQMASRLIELEEETFRASSSKLARATPLRDSCLFDIETAAKVKARPFSVGCTAAFAIRNGDSFDLLIHTRSPSTMTFGGSKAVIPNFGLEPNWTSGGKSRFGVLFYNFLKEYLEELFNYEELISVQLQRRPSPDWFAALPEAEDLLELMECGSFWVEFLGFGIDALNGTGNIALLAIVNDPDISIKLLANITANWKVAVGAPNMEPISFIDYQDPRLETWLREGQFQYGSAFTIDLALKTLADLQ